MTELLQTLSCLDAVEVMFARMSLLAMHRTVASR